MKGLGAFGPPPPPPPKAELDEAEDGGDVKEGLLGNPEGDEEEEEDSLSFFSESRVAIREGLPVAVGARPPKRPVRGI